MGESAAMVVAVIAIGVALFGLAGFVFLAWCEDWAQATAFLVVNSCLAGGLWWLGRGLAASADASRAVEISAVQSPTPTTPAVEAGPGAVPMVATIGALVLALVLYFVWVAVVRPKARAAAAARAKAKAQAELEKTRRAERRAVMGRTLRAAVALEDRVTSRWLAYEKDLELALRYPVMRDLRDPLVQAVVTAMSRARAARVEEIPELDFDQSPAEHPYVVAVRDLDVAMRAAEQEARRVRRGRFSREERRALRRAEQLLAIAKNDGASPHERRVAYLRLLTTLEGILDVPEAARTELETITAIRPQIEAPSLST